MAEMIKEIKTRVALRTGDYAYWTTGAGKDIELYKGEVCICTIEPKGHPYDSEGLETGAAHTAPTVLFKVADANGKKFGDLKWVSGLAADVYDWAKAATKPTYAASEITGLDEYIAGEIQDTNTDTQYRFAVEEGALSVYKTVYTLGVAGAEEKVGSYDFVTSDELAEILADYYTKEEVDNLIQGVNDKIDGLDESVTTVANGTGISVTDSGEGNDHAYTVAIDVAGAKTALGLDAEGIAAYETVESLNATAKGYADEVKTGVENGTIKAKTAEHADAAGKVDTAITVKVGGEDVVFDGSAAKTANVDAAIQAAIDAIPEVVHPEYSIVKDATSEYAATYHLTKDGVNVGAAINIPKDLVVESGKVETLEAGVWGEAGTYIILTLANATNDKIYVRVDSLIEYVTSGSTADSQVIINIDENHKVTATIGAGKVGMTELSDEVKTAIAKDDDTTYGFATKAGTDLTFTVTPSEGAAYDVTLEAGALAVKDTIETNDIVDKNVTEAKLEQNVQDALALARTALQDHQDITGKKDKQTAVADHNLSGATVVKGIAQNENGEITVSTRELTPGDIGAQPAGNYQPAGDYLTEIKTTPNGGLTIDKNKIDIDTDIVFVLNCNY